MQIDRLTHASISTLFRGYDPIAHDEIEVVFAGRELGQGPVERLLGYLRSATARRSNGKAPIITNSLDVAVSIPTRLGPVRVTLVGGDDQLRGALQGTDNAWSMATMMHKRKTRPSVEVHEHRLRVNMKREEPVSDAEEVAACMKEARQRTTGRKLYRLKHRFSFCAADPRFRYDITGVRQISSPLATWEEICAVPETYEVECEFVGDSASYHTTVTTQNVKEATKVYDDLASAMLKCFSVVLKVLDDTDKLMTVSQRESVLTQFLSLMYPEDQGAWTPQVASNTVQPRFLPGLKPTTLEQHHLLGAVGLQLRKGQQPSKNAGKHHIIDCDDLIEEDTPTLSPVVGVPYTVTDKADGVHRILFIASDGCVYTLAIDGFVSLRDTGMSVKSNGRGSSSIMDGEFIPGDATRASMFAIYDAFVFEKMDIRSFPLMEVEDNVNSKINNTTHPSHNQHSSKPIKSRVTSRLKACELVVSSIASNGKDHDQTLKVILKKFYRYEGTMDGLTTCCAKVIARSDANNFPYKIDGLIFTPAEWPMGAGEAGGPPKSNGGWQAAMKWKPPDQNSIDFLVRIIPGQVVSRNNSTYSLANLFVGYDPAKWDPVTTLALITDKATHAVRKASGSYLERLFGVPGESPHQSGLHVCHLRVDEIDGKLKCASGEEILESTIIEFAYDTSLPNDVPHSFRWVPLRARPDKTQIYVASGGEIAGTANDVRSALGIWTSILAPITEDVMCGRSALRRVKDVVPGDTKTTAYYVKKIRPGSGGMPSMRNFHNWVTSTDLIMRTKSNTTRSIFDIGCGRGGDLHTWRKLGVTRVLGVDKSREGIVDPESGANVRILEEKRRNGRRGEVTIPMPRIVLLPIDASIPIDAMQIDGMDSESGDRQVAQVVWSIIDSSSVKDDRLRKYHGFASNGGFDVVSCQFAVHYFFQNPSTLRAFATNVAKHLRHGGYFVGSCMDGHLVDKALGDKSCIQGVTDGKVIWRIQRLYEKSQFNTSTPSMDSTGLRIKVYVETIGQTIEEYLVDYRLLNLAMSEVGLFPPNEAQLNDLGLSASDVVNGTSTFEASFGRLRALAQDHDVMDKRAKNALNMTDDEKAFSFLNRWFVFVKADKSMRR